MEKFLSIPVTGEQEQLVSASGIVLIEQGSATTVTITYNSLLVTTITHAASSAGSEEMRDAIQQAVLDVYTQNWQKPSLSLNALPKAVSGIATAVLPQPTS
jgi:hypothetical protein